jgi:hypothetical protein
MTDDFRLGGGHRRLRLIQLSIVLGVAAAHYLIQAGFTIDDADITFAYVRSFLHGDGLGFLFGGDYRVEGYSTATWFALLAALGALGVPIPLAAKILGFVFALGTVAVAHSIAWRTLTDRRLAVGVVAVSTSLTFVLWSASGLENGLTAFLAVFLVRQLMVEEERGAPPWASALLVVVLALTRPEGFLYGIGAFVFMVARAVRRDARWRSGLGRAAGWVVSVAVPLAIYAAWHFAVFGVLFPNTVYAKAHVGGLLDTVWAVLDPLGATWHYAGAYVIKHAAIVLVPLAGYGAWLTRRSAVLALSLIALAALVLPIYQPDWMTNSRFFCTFTPLLVLLTLVGLDRLLVRVREAAPERGRVPGTRLTALACVPLFILANAVLSVVDSSSGYRMWITADEMHTRYQDVVGAAQRVGLADPLYLIPDIGAPAFRDDLRIVDGLGLSDAQIARNIGDARALDVYLFGERRPDLIRMHFPHTNSVPLDRMPSLRRDYVEIPATQDQGAPRAWIRRDDLTAHLGTAGQTVASGGGVQSFGSTTVGVLPDRSSALDLLWRRGGGGQASAAGFRLTIRSDGGAVVQSFEDALGYGWFPPRDWRPGEVVRAHVPLGRLAAGRYTAELEILDPSKVVLGQGQQPLEAGEAAARASVVGARQQAWDAVRAHDWDGVRDACRAAVLVDGPLTCADVIERARTELLAVATAAMAGNDANATAAAVHELANFRGRASSSSAERALASRLVTTARSQPSQGSRYRWALAASTADPTNAPLGLYLNCARRAFLSGSGTCS